MRSVCNRDHRGYRVPKPGTLSGRIYVLDLLGLGPARMAAALRADPNTVGVLLHNLRHPARTNAYKLGAYYIRKATRRYASP